MDHKANLDEVEAVKQVIRHLKKHGYNIGSGEKPDEGIGVITPYRVHSDRMRDELKKEFDMQFFFFLS